MLSLSVSVVQTLTNVHGINGSEARGPKDEEPTYFRELIRIIQVATKYKSTKEETRYQQKKVGQLLYGRSN